MGQHGTVHALGRLAVTALHVCGLVVCGLLGCAAAPGSSPRVPASGAADAPSTSSTARATNVEDVDEAAAADPSAGSTSEPRAEQESAEPEPRGGAAAQSEIESAQSEPESAVTVPPSEPGTDDPPTDELDALAFESGTCCGEDACAEECESPADCPRCRPLCVRDARGRHCSAPGPLEGRAECRTDAQCVFVDEGLPCQVCGRCSSGPEAWSPRTLRRAVREGRIACERARRQRPRCSPCPPPRPTYVPAEAICVEGRCVPHGGRVVPLSPLDSVDSFGL